MIQLSELLFLGLRGNAGSGTVCADFVNKSVLAVIIGVLLFLDLFDRSGCGLRQGTDGEGCLLYTSDAADE